MRVLVTGASGFIGSHICEALLKENYEVFALSRQNNIDRIKQLVSNKSLCLLRGGLNSIPVISTVLEKNKIEAVIHLAAAPSHGSREMVANLNNFKVNAKGTFNVVHSCCLAEVPKIIYASAMGVYGLPLYLPVDEDHPKNPVDFHGLTKLEGENYCQYYAEHYDLKVIVLRYSGVYGPGKYKGAVYNFIKNVLNNQPPQISGEGNQTKDLVYVGDVVEATLKALKIDIKGPFTALNIGSGRETSINELLKKIIEIKRANINVQYSNKRSDNRFVLDITKAENILGYRPRSLDSALKEYIKQYEISEID